VPALGLGWLTPAYDGVVRLLTREWTVKAALIYQAELGPELRVLDLAVGTGTLAIWIKHHEPRAIVTGVDADERILAIARRKAAAAGVEVIFEQAMAHALPLNSAHFDRVVSSLFFHHLTWPQKQAAVREVWRVLKPGGELHVADWGRPTSPLMRALFFSVQLLDGFAPTRDNVEGRLTNLFSEAGFAEVLATRTFNTVLGTMTLYRARKPEDAP